MTAFGVALLLLGAAMLLVAGAAIEGDNADLRREVRTLRVRLGELERERRCRP